MHSSVAPIPGDALANDADLASAARSDPQAFGALYLRHRDAIYRYLRGRGADAGEAAELTAVTFERAFLAISRYRPAGDGGALPWLLRIARNAAIDAARRRRGLRRLALLRADEHPVSPSDPEAEAIDDETVRQLRALVARLPESQREAIALRYASGLPAREIARVIGKSQAATEKLLQRGLATLRDSWREQR